MITIKIVFSLLLVKNCLRQSNLKIKLAKNKIAFILISSKNLKVFFSLEKETSIKKKKVQPNNSETIMLKKKKKCVYFECFSDKNVNIASRYQNRLNKPVKFLILGSM